MSRRAADATLLALVLAFLLPVGWLLLTGWERPGDVFAVPPTVVPQSLTLANFRTVAAVFDVPRLLLSSVVISGGSAALALLLGVPAGYALARTRRRWASGIGGLFLAIRLVPPVATLIPFYLLARDTGLLGTWLAVVLVDAMQSTAFVVWMMSSSFRAVPPDIEEAAALDGCSRFGAFLRVALPLVAGGLVTSTLFCVLFAWNDFLFPAFLTTLRTKPLSVALLSAYGTKDISWGTLGALAHVAILPIVLLSLVLNRYFVAGVTRGVN